MAAREKTLNARSIGLRGALEIIIASKPNHSAFLEHREGPAVQLALDLLLPNGTLSCSSERWGCEAVRD